MPPRTVGFASVDRRSTGSTTKDVLVARYGFEMIWIHTTRVAAKMIYLVTLWNRTHPVFVSPPMSHHPVPRGSRRPKPPISLGSFRCNPFPTLRSRSYAKLQAKPFLDCELKIYRHETSYRIRQSSIARPHAMFPDMTNPGGIFFPSPEREAIVGMLVHERDTEMSLRMLNLRPTTRNE